MDEVDAMSEGAMAVVNWLHLTAAILWLGAIFSGVLYVSKAVEQERPTVRDRLAAAYYTVLSPFAWGAVGLLAITGVVKTQAHLKGDGLLQTPWGRLLLLKLLVAACMISAGAYATYSLAPKLRGETARSDSPVDPERIQARLRSVTRLAAFLGLVLLFIVTLL